MIIRKIKELIERLKNIFMKKETNEYVITKDGIGELILQRSIIGKLYAVDVKNNKIGIIQGYSTDIIIQDVSEVIEVLELIIENSYEILRKNNEKIYELDDGKADEIIMMKEEAEKTLKAINNYYKKGVR